MCIPYIDTLKIKLGRLPDALSQVGTYDKTTPETHGLWIHTSPPHPKCPKKTKGSIENHLQCQSPPEEIMALLHSLVDYANFLVLWHWRGFLGLATPEKAMKF